MKNARAWLAMVAGDGLAGVAVVGGIAADSVPLLVLGAVLLSCTSMGALLLALRSRAGV